MAWRLARLIAPEGELWRLWMGGRERVERLPGVGAPGELVLLEGEPGDWRARCGPLHAGAWPEGLPRALTGLATAPAPQQPLFAVRGGWLIDAEGRPCEHGLLRTEDGFAQVLSYAGWRLGDLEGQRLPLQRVDLAEGALFLLQAEGCPEPLEGEAPLPREPRPIYETHEPRPVVVPPPVPPPEPPTTNWPAHLEDEEDTDLPPRAPVVEHVDEVFAFEKLIFRDGQVLATRPYGRLLPADAPWSRELFDALKVRIAEKLRDPRVRIHGHVGATAALVADKPEGLDKHFEDARFEAFLLEKSDSEQWVPLNEVSAHAPAWVRSEEPMPGLRALGLQDRAEALLHLYQMTVPDHPVMLLPKQAALFVVSGPSHTLTPQRFVVWEHVHEDNASYIFHWKGEQTFLDIQTLSQTPGWRKSLLSDLGNKKRLGYHKRVVHRADGDGDPMRAWKSKIDSALRS